MARGQVARGWVAKRSSQWPTSQRVAGQGSPVCQESHKAKRRGEEKESFVWGLTLLMGWGWRSYIYLRGWQVYVVPAFQGRRDYLNIGMGGGLLAQIFILLQTLFVHFCLCDKRQAVNQSCFINFFFEHCGYPPSPFQDLGWIYSLNIFLFPASREDTHRFLRALPCTIIVYLLFRMLGNLIRQGSGLLGEPVSHCF